MQVHAVSDKAVSYMIIVIGDGCTGVCGPLDSTAGLDYCQLHSHSTPKYYLEMVSFALVGIPRMHAAICPVFYSSFWYSTYDLCTCTQLLCRCSVLRLAIKVNIAPECSYSLYYSSILRSPSQSITSLLYLSVDT